MVDPSAATGPGVICVVEPQVHALLESAGVAWRVQERQASVGEMWASLGSGALDPRSRVLVFSDSLDRTPVAAADEATQTARAIAAMANAGAHVFVVSWAPDRRSSLDDLIGEAAVAQGTSPAALRYTWLQTDQGPRALLDQMRHVVGTEIAFPPAYPDAVDAMLGGTAPAGLPTTPTIEVVEPAASDEPPASVEPADHEPAAPPPAPIPLVRDASPPTLPPIGQPAPVGATSTATGYPTSASMELLNRPKRPGQVTITVTSSKGGSGKSTASILLGGSIARASADAGRPLSVCLIDLDTRDGQVASLIGKFMPTALNIRVQPVWDEDRIRRNLVHADGLDIDTLLAPIRPRTADTVGPEFYRTIVRSLQRMYDVVIMDTSVQYLEPLIAEVALGEADEILFVTTLASTAVQGMARALREITAPVDESGLGIPREKIGIIVNQSVANVGMEREQVLAAGLGVPVVGVIPLATKDVLTATNLNRMYALLDHPLLGPAYNELARACLPGRDLAVWSSDTPVAVGAPTAPSPVTGGAESEDAGRRKGLFRR